LPNVGPYIYDVSISGFTRSSIYIYDISSLRVKRLSVGRICVLQRRTFGRQRSLKHPTLRHSAWFSFGYPTTKNSLPLILKKETAHDLILQQPYRQNAIRSSTFIDNSNNRRRFKARLLDSVRRPVEAYLVHNSMSEALKTSLLVERIQEPC